MQYAAQKSDVFPSAAEFSAETAGFFAGELSDFGRGYLEGQGSLEVGGRGKSRMRTARGAGPVSRAGDAPRAYMPTGSAPPVFGRYPFFASPDGPLGRVGCPFGGL